ncbi:MAG: N-acetylmuramoyl-L-alanine amidase family protein [Coriobacteriales bacterium]|jgi:N-acetylmuramoyl-L-alanine amidase
MSKHTSNKSYGRHTAKGHARYVRRVAIITACVVVVAAAIIAGAVYAIMQPSSESSQSSQVEEVSQPTTQTSSASSSSTSKSASASSSSSSSSSASDASDSAPLSGYTICIDAGHSGSHTDSTPSPNNPDSSVSVDIPTEPGGASGSISGPEYKTTLAVAKKLQADLEKQGAEVVMVRTKNNGPTISPKERALIANKCNADMFIRLHCDGASSSVRGFYTLIPADTGYQANNGLYKKSQKMGRYMHNHIVKELGANDRGVTVRSDQGGFNWCKVPCVLFEMANLPNAKDDALIATDSYQEKLATAICNASVDWLTK